MSSVAKLKELYANNSKHSNYQILSDRLSSIIGDDQIEVVSRYERERLDYVIKNISLQGRTVLDIGGNSGFFTFEAIENGAKSVHHYEGNKEHSEFVAEASSVLGYQEKVEVTNAYYSFESEGGKEYDVVFLLNVLHHFGDDFGDETLSIEAAKNQMITQLNNMASKTDNLIFQLGFCWKGNRDVGLFEQGTKKELIDFIVKAVEGVWDIKRIGIPVKKDGVVKYKDLDGDNIVRDDSMGEFLNRPLFIMSVKK